MFSPPLAEIREKRCGSSRRTLPDQGFAPKRFRPGQLLANARASDVANRALSQLSHPEIAGSIKGDVNKKGSPSAGSREIFCLDIQPTIC
jgi:hypothetical protein